MFPLELALPEPPRNHNLLIQEGLHLFMRAAQAWQLTDSEQAGVLGLPVWVWRTRREEAHVNMERLSLILALFILSRDTFRDPRQADYWMKRGNARLPDNKSPLAHALATGISGLRELYDWLSTQPRATVPPPVIDLITFTPVPPGKLSASDL